MLRSFISFANAFANGAVRERERAARTPRKLPAPPAKRTPRERPRASPRLCAVSRTIRERIRERSPIATIITVGLVMLDWLYAPWFMLTGIIVLYVVPNSAIAPMFGKPASAQQTPTPAAATSAEHTTPVVAASAEETSTPAASAAEKPWFKNPGHKTRSNSPTKRAENSSIWGSTRRLCDDHPVKEDEDFPEIERQAWTHICTVDGCKNPFMRCTKRTGSHVWHTSKPTEHARKFHCESSGKEATERDVNAGVSRARPPTLPIT